MRNRSNFEGAIPFVSDNSDGQLKISRDMNIKRLLCELQGTLTISGGTTSGTPLDNMNFIKDIEVILDGKNSIKNFDGLGIVEKNRLMHGLAITPTPVASGDAAAYSFRSPFVIHFEGIRNKSPIDTLLNARHFKEILLKISFGSSADFITGGDRTLALTNTMVNVISEDTITPDVKFFQNTETYSTFTIAAVGENSPIELPKNGLIRRIWMKTLTTGGAVSDSIINYVDIQTNLGYFPFKKFYFDMLKDYNEMMFGIRPSTGWACIDFTSEGSRKFMLNANAYSKVDLIVNATAAGSMLIYYDWYINRPI